MNDVPYIESDEKAMSAVDEIIRNGNFKTVDDERAYFESAKVSEDVWSDWYQRYEYQRYRHPDVTIDCIILTYDINESDDLKAVKALSIQRFTHPFIGRWGLPGTFMYNTDADAYTTIRRLLSNRLGLVETTEDIEIRSLAAFTGIDRDPRGQVISLAYMVYIKDGMERIQEQPGVAWIPISEFETLDMCFDHNAIVNTAMKRLRDTFSYEPIILSTLPDRFIMADAFRIRQSIFYKEDFTQSNKKNFRKHYSDLWEKVGRLDESDKNSPGVFNMTSKDFIIRGKY